VNYDHGSLELAGNETRTIELKVLVIDKGEVVIFALGIGDSEIEQLRARYAWQGVGNDVSGILLGKRGRRKYSKGDTERAEQVDKHGTGYSKRATDRVDGKEVVTEDDWNSRERGGLLERCKNEGRNLAERRD
jgi:hypothetical protein